MKVVVIAVNDKNGRISSLFMETETKRLWFEGVPFEVTYARGICYQCRKEYKGFATVLMDVAHEWIKEHDNGFCPPKNKNPMESLE